MSAWQFNLDPEKLKSAKPSGRTSRGALFLSVLPFLAFGIFMLVKVFRIANGQNYGFVIVFSLFVLLICLVPVASVFLAGRKAKAGAATGSISVSDSKPWLGRADWADGRIRSSEPGQLKTYAFMAVVFCAVGGVSAIVALPKELPKGNYLALIVLLFPAVGLGFLAALIRGMLARRRYGDCVFEMAAVPAPLGGILEGLIQTSARLQTEHGLHLRLSCIRRTESGSGNSRSVSEQILWQDEKVLKAGADLPEPEPGHTGIPVHFVLPADQPESRPRGGDRIIWRLQARARMAGPEFHATFDLPVFAVAGATAAVDEADPTASLEMPVEELRRDEHSRIRVSDGPAGREFFFPAARNLGAAAMTTVLALIFGGVAGFIIHAHGPVLFRVAFSIFGLILVIAAFNLWFKSSRVTVDSGSVRCVNHWLFFRRTRRFAAADVAQFAVRQGMTSGGQVFWNIKLVKNSNGDDIEAAPAESARTGQRPPLKFEVSDPTGVTIAGGIADTAEAKWLAQEMTKALGRG